MSSSFAANREFIQEAEFSTIRSRAAHEKKKFESDPTAAEKVSFPCRGSRVRLRVEIGLFSVRFGLFSVVSGESVSLVCRGRSEERRVGKEC